MHTVKAMAYAEAYAAAAGVGDKLDNETRKDAPDEGAVTQGCRNAPGASAPMKAEAKAKREAEKQAKHEAEVRAKKEKFDAEGVEEGPPPLTLTVGRKLADAGGRWRKIGGTCRKHARVNALAQRAPSPMHR